MDILFFVLASLVLAEVVALSVFIIIKYLKGPKK